MVSDKQQLIVGIKSGRKTPEWARVSDRLPKCVMLYPVRQLPIRNIISMGDKYTNYDIKRPTVILEREKNADFINPLVKFPVGVQECLGRLAVHQTMRLPVRVTQGYDHRDGV